MIRWLRAWWRRRGEAACARGAHKWRRTPPQIAEGGMAALVDLAVMGYYDWAKCSRCGIIGKRVRCD